MNDEPKLFSGHIAVLRVLNDKSDEFWTLEEIQQGLGDNILARMNSMGYDIVSCETRLNQLCDYDMVEKEGDECQGAEQEDRFRINSKGRTMKAQSDADEPTARRRIGGRLPSWREVVDEKCGNGTNIVR